MSVHLYAEYLQILDASGAPLVRWPYEGLQAAEELYGGHALRLRHRSMPDARLIVDDPELQDALRDRIDGYRGRVDRSPLGTRIALAVGMLAVCTLGMVLVIPLLSAPLANAVPHRWERALGEHVADLMVSGESLCGEDEGRAVLARLVRRLEQADASDYIFHVRVTDDAQVNALAAPGGELILYRGLIDFAASGDEIAGVLAHEMAHVSERHGLRSLIRQLGLGLTFSALVGDVSGIAALAGQAGELLLELSHSRKTEAEADAIAVVTLAKAGLSTSGFADLFRRLEQRESKLQLPKWLSSHPVPEERAQAVVVHDGAPALADADWQALRAICGPGGDGAQDAEEEETV